jgi:hypothetical protein
VKSCWYKCFAFLLFGAETGRIQGARIAALRAQGRIVTPHVHAGYQGTVALTSLAASAGLTIAKAIVGLMMTGSLAILSEAGHSLIDFVATVDDPARCYCSVSSVPVAVHLAAIALPPAMCNSNRQLGSSGPHFLSRGTR